MDNFYVHLYCWDSITTHVDNHAGQFVIDLPKTFLFDGHWECAITEINFKSDFERPTGRIYVCCDLIEQSYVRNTTLGVLRSVPIQDDEQTDLVFNPLFYMKILRQDMNRIQIFIRDEELNPCRFKSGGLYCTLHFRKRWVR